MRLCGYLCSRTLSPRSFTVRFRHGQRPGGDEGNRTLDPLLAGQVLSQLSYTPILMGFYSSGPSKSNNKQTLEISVRVDLYQLRNLASA